MRINHKSTRHTLPTNLQSHLQSGLHSEYLNSNHQANPQNNNKKVSPYEDSLNDHEDLLKININKLKIHLNKLKWSLISEFSKSKNCGKTFFHKTILEIISGALDHSYGLVVSLLDTIPQTFQELIMHKVSLIEQLGHDALRKVQKVFSEAVLTGKQKNAMCPI
jgi:hypothetical protein